ncbi:hypothetical protein [Cellulomonas sp. KH9]|uniref:hypothetical protein n=1 Tax=Cellulomonas sp. KH9 TaxID=1855324 RepID=UPI0008E13FBB|nr:hypothetical protein [Cellulomonas sp. KH9]SFK01317.1 hypothetical protein SAMN05216467_1698 [Cellulomonas sp. KH9]
MSTHPAPEPARYATSGWRPAEPVELLSRLESARDMLREAAALVAAQEAATLAAMTEQQRRRGQEVRDAGLRRRRYR